MKIESQKKLDEIKKTLDNTFPWELRNKIIISTSIKTIAQLFKHLKRVSGQSILDTITRREIREQGSEDAKKIIEILNLKKKSAGNIKDVLRIVAALWGMKWTVAEDKKLEEEYPTAKPSNLVITECPFNTAAKENNIPSLCNICEEYTKGMLKELAGEDFTIIPARKMIRGDPYCKYIVVKRY